MIFQVVLVYQGNLRYPMFSIDVGPMNVFLVTVYTLSISLPIVLDNEVFQSVMIAIISSTAVV